METLRAQHRRSGEPVVSRRRLPCSITIMRQCRARVADTTDLDVIGASRASMTIAAAKMIQYASHCTYDGWQSQKIKSGRLK